MNENWKIRLADQKYAKNIADIIKRHHESDYMGYATFDDKYVKDKMKKNNFYFVAENIGEKNDKDKKIIGCIRVSIVDLDLAEVRTLCVDEEYRRKGIGKNLLETALNIMKEKNMRKIVARSKPENKDAINLFKKLGFEQEGYFKEHYRKGIDIVQMGKFL